MPRDAVTGDAEVDVKEGRRLLERWRDYTLAYANDAEDVTLEEWEEAAKEAEDWAVENGLPLIRRADRLEARVRDSIDRIEKAKGICYAHGLDLAGEELRAVAEELRAALSPSGEGKDKGQ